MLCTRPCAQLYEVPGLSVDPFEAAAKLLEEKVKDETSALAHYARAMQECSVTITHALSHFG